MSCHACGDTNKQLKKCAKCRYAKYCGKQCQKRAWPVHSRVCELACAGYSIRAPNKSPAIVALLDATSLTSYGRTATEAFTLNVCVVCGVVPPSDGYNTTADHLEYETISRTCPACWIIEFMPGPEESTKDEIEVATALLAKYGRRLRMSPKPPHRWICEICQAEVSGSEKYSHAGSHADLCVD